MPRRLLYFAQPYWSTRREPAERYEFRCAVDAEEGGRLLMAGLADGVLVYQQWVDPEAEIYGEPEVLARHGDVPSAALAIDGDGRDPWLDDAA